jgi:RimJ/RimL family protein N-acetyltransferase
VALHVTLEGRRVRLEPLEDRHHDELFAISREPRIWALQRVRADESTERFDEWYASVEMGFAHYFDDRLVGHTSYGNDEPHNRAVEVGNTWLVPDAWSSGANAEAKYLLLRHAFEDEGYSRVSFKTESTNARSRAALAALPAEFEGIFRKHMLVRGGERRDSAWYAVIDDDWPAVKASLERRLGWLEGGS